MHAPAAHDSRDCHRESGKVAYQSLSEVLGARSWIARHRGKRFRHLRIYRSGSVYHLTKMRKGQYQGSVARRRVLGNAQAGLDG
jgi:hypothetical protein